MTSQNPLKEGSQVDFYLNEPKCVRTEGFLHNNLNQSGMFDQLCFMQIYGKIWAIGWTKIENICTNSMLLLTNCEVHTEKYSDRSFEVRTVRKADVRIFSHMDRNNWSIRVLLCSYNQRPKTKAFSKFSTELICVFLECSCWKGNFFQFPYFI